MAAKQKYDWAKIKIDFIKDREITLKSVADRYDISYDYLRRKASQENWTDEKEQHWEEAEEQALSEVGDSTKDLLSRHGKSARYLQVRALKIARSLMDRLEETNPDVGYSMIEMMDPSDVISLLNSVNRIIKNAWGAERELYPKQLDIGGKMELELQEVSQEVKEAIHEVAKRKLRAKPRESSKSDRAD